MKYLIAAFLLVAFLVVPVSLARDTIRPSIRIKVQKETANHWEYAGSGVVFRIDEKNHEAYILSCAHILDSNNHKTMFLQGEFFDRNKENVIIMKDVHRLTLIKHDYEKDLSLMKYKYVVPPDFNPLAEREPKIRERVSGVGFPLCKFPDIRSGEFLGFDEAFNQNKVKYRAENGLSGCGVYNAEKELIGILTHNIGGKYAGIIPLDTIKGFLNDK